MMPVGPISEPKDPLVHVGVVQDPTVTNITEHSEVWYQFVLDCLAWFTDLVTILVKTI